MKKAMLLAIILLFSINAYALQAQEDPNLEGYLLTEETQSSTKLNSNLQDDEIESSRIFIEESTSSEEPDLWENMNPFNWFSKED